jgi:hypothetical protein
MTIRARRTSALNANLTATAECELATLWAEALEGAALRIPALVSKSTGLALQTYPNPAQDQAILRFNLDQKSSVSAKLTDAMGRVVWTLASGSKVAGAQEVIVDTRNFANGVYSLVLTSEAEGVVRVENAKVQVRH